MSQVFFDPELFDGCESSVYTIRTQNEKWFILFYDGQLDKIGKLHDLASRSGVQKATNFFGAPKFYYEVPADKLDKIIEYKIEPRSWDEFIQFKYHKKYFGNLMRYC